MDATEGDVVRLMVNIVSFLEGALKKFVSIVIPAKNESLGYAMQYLISKLSVILIAKVMARQSKRGRGMQRVTLLYLWMVMANINPLR